MADYNYNDPLADLISAQTTEKAPETTPKAAEGQSSEVTKKAGEGAESPAEAQAKEAKRMAAAKADWEKVLGEKIGGQAWAQISKHVTYESFLGYAKKAVDSLSGVTGSIKPTKEGAAGGLMDEQGEADAVKKFADALMPAIQAAVVEWLESESGQKVLGGAAEWIQEHPRTMVSVLGAALVGAAVGAYLSNMDPGELKQTFKIGDNLKVGAGVDIGPLQSLSIQAAHLSVEYASKHFKGSVGVKHDAEKGQTVEGAASYQNGGFKASASGSHHVQSGDTKAQGALSYTSGGFTGDVGATHDSKAGTTQVTGGASYERGGFKGNVKASHDVPSGESVFDGGAAYSQGGFSAGVTGKHSTATGATTAQGNLSGTGRVGRLTANTTADVTLAEDGRLTTKINGGLEGLFGASMTGGLTHASGGALEDSLRVEGGLKLGKDGEHRISGWSETETGAFGFQLDRSLLDGQGSMRHSVTGDANGDVTTRRDFNLNLDKDRALSFGDSMGADGQSQHIGYSDKDLFGTGASFTGSHTQGPAGAQTALGLGLNLERFKGQMDLAMGDQLNQLGLHVEGQPAANWSASGDLKLNLDEGRISELGAQVGWKDPEAFKSFMLKYKGTWMEENPGYAHQFDAAFEYAVGNWATRVKGGVGMEGADLSKANVDALVGYKINKDWAALGGVDYQKDFQTGDDRFRARAGAQYKDVALTATYDPGTQAVGLQLEVKLFSW
ncbi:hypothetical protein KKB55_03680 [Myxococcota bacterium]|nr:hypothetical protein [Myxococcota bacterium]MBU1896854.1 hypothetical protein [Myxococcota bacterium]